MKRTIFTLLAIVSVAICQAAGPNLASEKIFERDDIRTEGHELVKVTSPQNYFRSITAKKDPKLLKAIKTALDQDRKRAFNVVEGFDGKQDYIILNIKHNGQTINVGSHFTAQGYVDLFIQSTEAAFK